MLGKLNEMQMEELLKKQVTGRIACTDAGVPYIVPVNYVYDGKQVIGHSTMGKKIEMMRKNPRVCFAVDDIKTIFNWQSVIAWGRFEEITDIAEKEQAMMAITHRLMPFAEKPANHPSHGLSEREDDIGTKLDLILYKIVLVNKTGRFERN
ncbi:pyridoxamine 5'-phosphate oxidase family protein [Mucilaginibacter ginsenosidivorax]|uniref:Pyridoxamine 5'-phosphate oxidase family protein n=1 Tax=Mucilaginibacter ginsenosidivorax TaxID=862126 RepID=A0A5B8W707_9SPHI|nr:pyridoxamine 5'-phosphate oxidase family protein [Mucilaginibacter ginsenosidivorax]QEC79247.1 pyridoxamine 5'-phosphate oxidase family protein [Mucilaginibacter ginsenosidivorax]